MRTKTAPLAPELSPAPEAALVPTPAATGDLAVPLSPTPHLDAHGYDPADYRWVPVRRRPRADGWTEERQRAFIEALADMGSVDRAARSVGMTRVGAYALRRAPGSEGFARAWDAAVAQAVNMLVDVAFERAVHGTEEVVFDRDGRRCGVRHRNSDRLLMFLLAAHYPDRYGRTRRRRAGGNTALPIAEALDRLAPVAPEAPEALLDREALNDALLIADLGDGTVPYFLDPYRPRPDAPPPPPRADDPDLPYLPEPGPLGEAFGIELELAKRGIVPPAEPRRRRKPTPRV
ncbi:hypothetical protein [Sphingomonas sp. VNH70]|uniref:hypothetical protein n=1 Tax=Sphingomonas silueang TaxID=3156617 RepID=UPI0032B3CAD7